MGENKKDIQKLKEDVENLENQISGISADLVDIQIRISLIENSVRRLMAKVYEDDN